MGTQLRSDRPGIILSFALSAVVLSFMGLSLMVTTIGTARFAAAMGYRVEVGYFSALSLRPLRRFCPSRSSFFSHGAGLHSFPLSH